VVQSAGGVTRGEKFHWRRITLSVPNDCGGAKKSQQCHNHFLQCSTFCFRKTSGYNMGAPNLLLAPGPIYPLYAPVIQETSFVKKLIHSLLCCKTTMQTNCGLTNCSGNCPETSFSFSFWRLVNTSVRRGATVPWPPSDPKNKKCINSIRQWRN